MNRLEFLEIIKSNIEKNQFHITYVFGGQNPNFAYTIGITKILGFELIYTGSTVSSNLISSLIRKIFNELHNNIDFNREFQIENEYFNLVRVDLTWSKYLMVGVFDFYSSDDAIVYQIISKNKIFETPNMLEKFDFNDSIWKWYELEWNLNAPNDSYVITDIDFLRGNPIIQVARWKENQWEMFSKSGDDIKDEEIRQLPLGTVLGIDDSLYPCLDLTIEEGLWRKDEESDWNKWE